MLDSVFRMIRRPGPAGPRARLDLAAAAILSEAARLKTALLNEEERQTIAALVRTRFMLSPPAAGALADLASDKAVEAYRVGMFTDLVAEVFTREDRQRLQELVERLFSSEPALARSAATMRDHLSTVLALEHESNDSEAKAG